MPCSSLILWWAVQLPQQEASPASLECVPQLLARHGNCHQLLVPLSSHSQTVPTFANILAQRCCVELLTRARSHICSLLSTYSRLGHHRKHWKVLLPWALHSGNSHQPACRCFFYTYSSPIWPNCRCQCHGTSVSITHSGDDISNSEAGMWPVTFIPASKPALLL